MLPVKEWWPTTKSFFREVWSEMKKVTLARPGRGHGTTIVVIIAMLHLRLLPLRRGPRPGRVVDQIYKATRSGGRMITETRRRRSWYIVHTYSGFEERVRQNLRQRVEAIGMEEQFGEIRIPTETLVEMKGGKRREIQRKFFPGYILVEMEMSDDGLASRQEHAQGHRLRRVRQEADAADRGGGRADPPPGGTRPRRSPSPSTRSRRASTVRITDGPFTNFTGVVEEVNLDRVDAEGHGHDLRPARRRSSSISCRCRSCKRGR